MNFDNIFTYDFVIRLNNPNFNINVGYEDYIINLSNSIKWFNVIYVCRSWSYIETLT